MKLTTVLMLFVLGLLSSRTTMRADSFPSTPGYFTTIDVPGATSTSINAISSSGNWPGRLAIVPVGMGSWTSTEPSQNSTLQWAPDISK